MYMCVCMVCACVCMKYVCCVCVCVYKITGLDRLKVCFFGGDLKHLLGTLTLAITLPLIILQFEYWIVAYFTKLTVIGRTQYTIFG